MTVAIVGGEIHERIHRAVHTTVYLPILRLAFGDETTWGSRTGCVLFAGEGREAQLLSPYCESLVVTDGNPECLAVLRTRFAPDYRVTVVDGNGVDLSNLPDDTFDLCTALVALMHIGPASIRQNYSRDLARILAPGGRALVQMMEGEGYESLHRDAYGAGDVGFPDEEALLRYWSQFLCVNWILRTPPLPKGRPERCWWWVCMTKGLVGAQEPALPGVPGDVLLPRTDH